MALSSSCVSVHLIPQLSIEGKKVLQARPHTTCGPRKDELDEESEHGTYVIEGKTERQTRVKLESLERRLRMNEKSRKETEEQLETWKARAMKAENLIPELQAKLMEEGRRNEILKELSEDSEAKCKVSEEEKSQARDEAEENEKRLRELCCHVASLLVDDQQELDVVRQCPAAVLEKIRESLTRWKTLEEENRLLLEQIRKHEERLEKSRSQVESLSKELQQLKKKDVERRDEQLQELHLSNESSHELKQNLHRMENSASQFQLETEMLRAELRCVKSRNLELEQSQKSLSVLTRSAESEKKAFMETIAVLLGKEETDEISIKRGIRQLISEVEKCRSEREKLEAETKKKEDNLLNQAKQLRNALFRARTSEEEVTVFNEKFQALEHELAAAELELTAAQKKLQELEEGLTKLAELLEVKGHSQLEAVLQRVVELVNFEIAYTQLLGDAKIASDLRLLRLAPQNIESIRKRIRVVEGTAGAKKTVSDLFDKQLLTQVTLDTIRAADTQKVTMKYKLNEQEKKIRNLEKERRETEKLRAVLSKWEKKEPQVTKETRERTLSHSQKKTQKKDN